MIFSEELSKAAALYPLSLTQNQAEAYNKYFDLLIKWNQQVNLTAITQPDQVAVKHMIDSISCFDQRVFFTGAHMIDVGTGAGFPGLRSVFAASCPHTDWRLA